MAGNEPQRKRARNPKEPVVIQAKDPSRQPGELKRIGGSMSDDWNNRIANDTVSSLWLKNSDEATRDRQLAAAIAGLVGIHPRDELEGMMAAQLIAALACAHHGVLVHRGISRPVRACVLGYHCRMRQKRFCGART